MHNNSTPALLDAGGDTDPAVPRDSLMTTLTAARCSDAILQLNCTGKACKPYQPEAIRCANVEGSGNGVDWKCEADLPSSLRLGQVRALCEGWLKPGDSYVLQGSCGLGYRLVKVPKTLQDDYTGTSSSCTSSFSSNKLLSTIFSILWASVLVYIAYTFIRHIILSREWGSSGPPYPGNRGTGPRLWGPGSGGGFTWFGGWDHRGHSLSPPGCSLSPPVHSPSPPPPYKKDGPLLF